MKRFLTSESVAEGHPDKICDQISDAVLDELLKQDPHSRVACETFITRGLVIVGGEITTQGYVELNDLVRQILRDIGYTKEFGLEPDTVGVLNAISPQSPDIAQGVNRGGAGDQGTMIGYATNETPERMPLPIMLAHKLMRRLSYVRKNKILPYLGPDGKAQVTVEYEDNRPLRVSCIVLSFQHTPDILDATGMSITDTARDEAISTIIKPVLGDWLDDTTRYFINPTGKFVIGGPISDTGMTGRKIIVDTYGSTIPHGGGAFSGKDPTKVDRSAAYMARYLAKNIVEAGLADRILVSLSYSIGVSEPVAIDVNTLGTGKIPDERLRDIIKKHFDLTPRGIIDYFDLLRPIYRQTACCGHFGRPDLPWEKTDAVDIFLKAA